MLSPAELKRPMDMTTSEDKLRLSRHPGDSRLSWQRRQLLSGAGLECPRTAMEVGAFDNPTLRASDGFAVRYVDYFSSEELRAKHADNPKRDVSRIVDVDWVVKGPRLSPFIGERMDLIVANHVIEHICNPIGWLSDVASFCSPGATVFMAVPDRRFTFDYLKQPTDITDIVQAYEQGKEQPDAHDVARMRYLHTRVDAAAIWDGGEGPVPPQQTAAPYRATLERAREEVRGGYVDVHCTYFTSSSFIHIFSELKRSDYIPWRVDLLHDVVRGGNEFYVLLTLDG